LIVVVSTSSPLVSLAAFDEDFQLLYTAEEFVAKNASGWLLRQLDLLPGRDISGLVSDIGPGSFIGARVGITLVKVLAEMHQVDCGGVSAFDLISSTETVAIPNRKSDWCLRSPGQPMLVTAEIPESAIFYRTGNPASVYPAAHRAGALLASVSWQSALDFLPVNEVPPSISQPAQPFAARVTA